MRTKGKTLWLVVGILIVLTNASSTNSARQPKRSPEVQSKQSVLSSQKTDLDHESTSLIAKVLYRRLASLSESMTPNGANGANVDWERGQAADWYIESQRYGEDLVSGGLIKNDPAAIQAGFKMFDWGFAHQAADGSFDGTGDPFHSTSFFVEAVARTLLVIQQSPQSEKYAAQVARYKPLVHRAARWMILSDVWKKGTKNNQPYTHRRYLVAAALGCAGKLTGDQELIDYARQSIQEGLSLQRPDGVNPEKGGEDSSYQIVGAVYAQRWLVYFPNDPLSPKVVAMLNKALAWEQTRVLPWGEVSRESNSRTRGQEVTRTGKIKTVDYRSAIRGFAYWASVTGDSQWAETASRIAQYYLPTR